MKIEDLLGPDICEVCEEKHNCLPNHDDYKHDCSKWTYQEGERRLVQRLIEDGFEVRDGDGEVRGWVCWLGK